MGNNESTGMGPQVRESESGEKVVVRTSEKLCTAGQVERELAMVRRRLARLKEHEARLESELAALE